MKVGIVGGRSFAVKALELCLGLEGVHVHAVWPEDTKLWEVATDHGIPTIQGEDIRQGLRRGPQLDLWVSAHNHMYIPRAVLERASLGAIGYHPSLLPRHRGIDAVRWTIEMEDPVAGGTIYWLDGGIDTGPILLQDWCHVRPGWGASELWREELFPMGLRLLEAALGYIRTDVEECGRPPAGRKQDETCATHEPPFDSVSVREEQDGRVQ